MFDHPFVPGDTSAIEPGPWHHGADYVAVYFDCDPEGLKRFVPEPFDVEDGSCIAYVCEIVSVSDSKRTMVSSQPDRTQYCEAAVGIRSTFGEKRGVYFPAMWVTTEWALMRGLLNGYQKTLADRIAMTKLHPLNPGLSPLGRGSELSGFCIKGAERTLSIRVKVERKGEPQDLPNFGATFGMRKLSTTDQIQAEAAEAVEVMKWNARISNVWLGEGSVETELELGKPKVTGGAVYRSGFTTSGSRVLTKAQEQPARSLGFSPTDAHNAPG